MQTDTDGDDSDKHVEFVGGNVQLITTKESWDQKLAEASRDGKIVCFLSVLGAFFLFLLWNSKTMGNHFWSLSVLNIKCLC